MNRGFSLIELSVLLLIFSGLAVIALQNYTAGSEVENLGEVHDDLRLIKESIISYANAQAHYPCPADPTLPASNANFAKGLRNADGNCDTTGLLTYTDPTVDRTNIHSIYNLAANDIIMGTVPCEDLGLPKRCMISPEGHKYSYAVSTHTSRIDPCDTYISDTANSSIVVPTRFKMLKSYDPSESLADNYANAGRKHFTTATNEPHFVLVYFGKDGIGAWTEAGTRITSIQLSSSGGYINDNSYQLVNHNIGGVYDVDEYFLAPGKPLDTPDANLTAAQTPLVFGDVLVFENDADDFITTRTCLRCRNCSVSHQDVVVRLSSFSNCSTSPMPTVCE